MLNGWQTKTAQELDATIRTWAEVFARYEIPLSAYSELYLLAFDVRQRCLQNDPGKVPMMDATLIVSQWDGEYGLRNTIRQREYDARVKAGRTLGTSPEADAMPTKEGFEYLQSLLDKQRQPTSLHCVGGKNE